MQVELELLQGDDVVQVLPMVGGRLHVGRSAGNELVVADEQVSKFHAVFEREADALFLTDLRSTNGTRVGGEPLTGSCQLEHGTIVSFGAVRVRVRLLEGFGARPYVVENLTAGTRHMLESDRFRIGSAPDADLVLPAGPARAATLLLHPDGELWLGADEDNRPLELDEVFEVGGLRLRVTLLVTDRAPTVRGRRPTKYPYTVTVGLDGPGGPVARVTDLRSGAAHGVTSANRATLLFLLARRLLADRERGRPEDEAGWCDDADILVGIWGRTGFAKAPSNYPVLVHRLRKELEKAGFDPWFIEKRRGAIRLRAETVILE